LGATYAALEPNGEEELPCATAGIKGRLSARSRGGAQRVKAARETHESAVERTWKQKYTAEPKTRALI
jgi:hypothetical protein